MKPLRILLVIFGIFGLIGVRMVEFGFHRFTASDTEHAKNARDYQEWLNSKNIK